MNLASGIVPMSITALHHPFTTEENNNRYRTMSVLIERLNGLIG
jgi:hypothetical protein